MIKGKALLETARGLKHQLGKGRLKTEPGRGGTASLEQSRSERTSRNGHLSLRSAAY